MTTRRASTVEHPLLPSEANTVLSVVVFLFASGGALSLLGFVVVVVGKLARWELLRGIEITVVAVLIRLIAAVGFLWTARLLNQRRRLGGLLGLAFVGLDIVTQLLAGPRVAAAPLIIPVAAAVALAFAWTHLTD